MANPDDQLVKQNGEEAATTESSPVDTPHDPAETEAAGTEAPSASEESEHQVPLRHLLDERRRRAEAERELRELKTLETQIKQERALFEQARPEIQRIVAEREALEAKAAELSDELEMLRQVAEHAKANGLELPNDANLQMKRLTSQLNQKLKALETLPQMIDQRLAAAQQQNDTRQQEVLARAALDASMRKFEEGWKDVVAALPEMDGDDDMREIAFEKWHRDGGQKPPTEYFRSAIAASKAGKVRTQAKQQVTAANAPRSAVAGSQGGAPRATAPAQPTTWSQFWDSFKT